ncbi:MAG TPA: ATP-dependent DNA helicase RecG [Polyangiaceae bacterium]
MRPEILFPLFAPVTALRGIGPRLAPLVERAAGPLVVDLLWHLPSGLIDRRSRPRLVDAREGEIVTLDVTVDRHLPPHNKRLPYKVRCFDETGFVTLVFFHARSDYLARALPVGEARVVSGRLERFGGEVQMAHPDYIVRREEAAKLPLLEPTYPLTGGLPQKVVGRAMRAALERAPDLPEWLDAACVAREGWPQWHEALLCLHQPSSPAEVGTDTAARLRLAYDELLAHQLSLVLMRQRMRRRSGRPLVSEGRLVASLIDALPYTLTGAQRRALNQILDDLGAPTRMMRLLQGDVGSGKTVVALLAMAAAVEAGTQAALMAPTEILAQQHFEVISPLVKRVGLKAALLLGRMKGTDRETILQGLAAGSIDILIGTHALFQEGVGFRELGLAVVDEQHRFGVHQRMQLGSKGDATDVLVMTATPIPRTLTLAVYGDMDVSRLDERPPGRKPVKTSVLSVERLPEVFSALQKAVARGERAFWVCPLVEVSEDVDAVAAEDRHASLRAIFGDKVALLHGRLSPAAKDRAIADFDAGRVSVLVATSVIEVGVDIPAANLMVVEQAERFGLSQLHQLRGRVGRGAAAGSCLLLYKPPLGATARQRLRILKETDDGFRIAEEDLRLRGAGDVLGTRQSGLPVFRIADLERHERLLDMARDDALTIAEKDPKLATARGAALRTLLYLFQRDEAVGYLHAG